MTVAWRSPSTRRTLPAPSEPLDVDAVRAERDLLLLQREDLQRQLAACEPAVRRAAELAAEVRELRDELSRLRDEVTRSSTGPASARAAPLVGVPRDAPASFDARSGEPVFADAPPTGAPVPAVPRESQGLDFGTVSRLTPAELDGLPYGLITLDAKGRVVHYNDTESRLARLPRDRVLGKDFFADVAPCARVREFEGEFRALAADPSGVRVRSFDFVFRFRHSEQHVTIVMTPARQRGLFNVALLRRSITPR